MLTKEKLQLELEDLTSQELETITHLVQALKRQRTSPLAYVEEMIHYEYVGKEEETGTYLHRMQITDELRNRYEILHGGITATFIDTAMGATIFQLLGDDAKAVTLDLNIHFLNKGEDGWLYAYTNVVKAGKTIVMLECKVVDEKEKIVATASSTFYHIK
jgi:acyl-CoA thioesterase